MQCCKTQVTCFREHQSRTHGFRFPNLADLDQVRGLAHGIDQPILKRVGVNADLSLINDTVDVVVDELDRIFYRDDVATCVTVAVSHHCRLRGGLTRTGTTDEKHQTDLVHRDLLEGARWQAQFLKRRNLDIDSPGNQPHLVALLEHIDSEPADIRGSQGKVALFFCLEFSLLLVIHD